MNDLTVAWIAKAEGAYATAGRELGIQEYPNYDAVCFHAQQTAEKYLKAFLQENSVPFETVTAVRIALHARFESEDSF